MKIKEIVLIKSVVELIAKFIKRKKPPVVFPSKIRHFSDYEVRGLSLKLVEMLDGAREMANIPFIITSGFRSHDENEMIPNSVSNSSHLTGLAADLSCGNSNERYRMIRACLANGFNRIGVYDKHIHVDVDPEKPQEVIWLGDK